MTEQLQQVIDAAWEERDQLDAETTGAVRDAVEAALAAARFRRGAGRRERARTAGRSTNG